MFVNEGSAAIDPNHTWAMRYATKLHNKTHVGLTTLKVMVKYDYKLPKQKRLAFSRLETSDLQCTACAEASTTKKHPSDQNETGAWETWTSDVATNFPRSRYHNTNLFVWVSPLGYGHVGFGKFKDEVLEFTTLNYPIWNQEETFVKAKTDRGGEYISAEFEAWFKAHGISHSKTAPNSSCGKAEAKIRQLKHMSKAFLNSAGASSVWWDECTAYSNDVANFLPSWSKYNKGKSAYEARYSKPPPLHRLHTWGCLCFAHDSTATTYANRGRRCAFLGLAKNLDDGYRLWTGNSVIHSNSVTFIEDVSYFSVSNKPKSSQSPTQECYNPLCRDNKLGVHDEGCDFHPNFWDQEERQFEDNEEEEISQDDSEPRTRKQTQTFDPQGWDLAYKHDQEHANVITNTISHIEQSNIIIDTVAEIGTHLHKISNDSKLQERIFTCLNDINAAAEDLHNISDRYNKRGQLRSELIPNNEAELQNSEDRELWVKAKLKEMEMLTEMKTFAKILRKDVPAGRKTIKTRWVYDIKRLTDNTIERYKARMVAKGYLQRLGLDYSESFAPTPDLVSIRLILAYALECSFFHKRYDVSSAFLFAEVPENESIFIEPPAEWNLPPKWSFKLLKMLYGLVQASRTWALHIAGKFKKHNYTQSLADSCVFVHHDKDGEVDCVNGIHTDDGVLVGTSPIVDNTLKMLSSYYKIRETTSSTNPYIGMKIHYSEDGQTLELSQEAFIDNILETHGMTDCNPSHVPARERPVLPPDGPMDEKEAAYMLDKQIVFMSVIGALLYLTRCTRPDIAYAVGYLSRFTSKPRKVHYKALKMILRYLKGTKSYGLRYTKSGKTDNGRVAQCLGHADADHAGDVTDYHSTSGFCFNFAGAAIDWGSYKQTGVARSTTEAEIVALDTASRRALWIRKLEKDLNIGHGEPTTIFEDNNGAISWSVNKRRTKQTKHIAVKFFAISDDIEHKRIAVKPVATDENTADIFTKGLAFPKFSKFRAMLGVVDLNKH